MTFTAARWRHPGRGNRRIIKPPTSRAKRKG